MTNKDIIALYNALKKLDHKGAQFNYGVSRNITKLEPFVKALQKADEFTPEYKEYEEKRMEILKTHSIKDTKGNPLIVGNSYQFSDKAVVEKEIENLGKEHKKALKEREEQDKAVQELLNQEQKVTLFKVKQDYLPEDIRTQEMIAIMAIME